MKTRTREHGVTLIETMLATLVATIAIFGMCSTIFVATVNTNNQGTETTRAAVYAQDKLEKLLSLASVPVSTTTASFQNCLQPSATQQSTYPDCNTTGITGTGWATGLLPGGIISSLTSCSAPNIGYMDFLGSNGNQLTGASCSAALTGTTAGYIRQWQIIDQNTFGSTAALKQIIVAVWSMQAVNTDNTRPLVIVTSYVSDPD